MEPTGERPRVRIGSFSFSAQQMEIAFVVTMYFIISISLVFVNKSLMTPGASMDAPLFVTWFQCVVTVAIQYALGLVSKSAPAGSWLARQGFPEYDFDVRIARKVLKLSLVFVGMIAFNNLCLQRVEVSFYQVARSLTVVFNVALTYLVLGERTSRNTLVALGVVVGGFWMGVDSEARFSFLGTLFGVTSSLFVSLNSIVTKTASEAVNRNKWRLSAYNNTLAAILFLPLIIVTGEVDVILDGAAFFFSFWWWMRMLVGAFFGFAIGIATIEQIRVTSPLTHNISGTVKATLQTVLALMIWRNPTSFKNMFGTLLTLGGSLVYSYVRNGEMEAEAAAKKLAAAAVAPARDAEHRV